jgi:Holliday junction DNA helicase RuvA
MIAQISGILISKKATEVVIDCNGIGYQLYISVSTSDKLSEIGTNIKLQTLLIHREDAMQLFGFYDENEKEVFKLLISISGIGPKSAIAILSAISISELKQAILENNLILLQKMPGIGKKTAERLIIELREKIAKIDIGEIDLDGSNIVSQEAISALIVLGYNKLVAEKAVKQAINSLKNENIEQEKLDLSIENILRLSLKLAMK